MHEPIWPWAHTCASAFALATLAGCGGSASDGGYPADYGYEKALENVKAIHVNRVLGDSMTIPRARAEFCLQRAQKFVASASRASTIDSTLLVIAGLGMGTGVSLNAAAAAMDGSGTRTDVRVAGAITTTAGAAVIALREALGTRDFARAERTAAGRNIEAAFRILELYAVTPDPKDVQDTGFAPCADGEERASNALPGGNASAISKLTEDANQAKADAKAASAQAAQAEQKGADADLKLRDAQALPPVPGKGGTAADPAIVARQALVAELVDAKSSADKEAEAKSCEAARSSAKARVLDAQVALLGSVARLRRAVFLLGGPDVTADEALVEHARLDLESSRAAQAKAEECGAATRK